ncbi:hypothetical protein E4T42_09468 [Aureobasidium subglaciale]|nr:hypothetical protein E4T42_09468 [Aureobasidium subglaciale]
MALCFSSQLYYIYAQVDIFNRRHFKMAYTMTKDSDTFSDTFSDTSTLRSGIATTDFAPRTTKNTEFVALQTLLETPELGPSTSSSTNETIVESQSILRRNKRRKTYWVIGLTVFGSVIVLTAILSVVLGPKRLRRSLAITYAT